MVEQSIQIYEPPRDHDSEEEKEPANVTSSIPKTDYKQMEQDLIERINAQANRDFQSMEEQTAERRKDYQNPAILDPSQIKFGAEDEDNQSPMQFSPSANLNDQREGGEFLDQDGYQGDAAAYLSTSHCNIQADDSDDSDEVGNFSFRSNQGLIVAQKPSEDNSPVKVESFQRLSSNEIVAARIRKELENRHQMSAQRAFRLPSEISLMSEVEELATQGRAETG